MKYCRDFSIVQLLYTVQIYSYIQYFELWSSRYRVISNKLNKNSSYLNNYLVIEFKFYCQVIDDLVLTKQLLIIDYSY